MDLELIILIWLQPSYNENTPLGFRTGYVAFMTEDGGNGESTKTKE